MWNRFFLQCEFFVFALLKHVEGNDGNGKPDNGPGPEIVRFWSGYVLEFSAHKLIYSVTSTDECDEISTLGKKTQKYDRLAMKF